MVVQWEWIAACGKVARSVVAMVDRKDATKVVVKVDWLVAM